MDLLTADFTYNLPEDRIALFPSAQRDQSKLLVYKNGTLEDTLFKNITEYLPKANMLVFNNSRVIPARLKFKKESGAGIEIFLLNPIAQATETELSNLRASLKTPLFPSLREEKKVHQAEGMGLIPQKERSIEMPLHNSAQWVCTIGNKKRWTRDSILRVVKSDVEIQARLIDRENSIVQFLWSGNKTWEEILLLIGDTPLPPYIKRDTVESDKERYQTVYSSPTGAVAAPTAGLHFTPEILEKLISCGFSTDFITLHVGAGTFQPIKAEKATDHRMHEEKIIFTKENLENLIEHGDKIICVGTTSCRSLESLYWFGVKLLSTKGQIEFNVDQSFPYQYRGSLPSRMECLTLILDYMSRHNIKELIGATSIFIYPGYKFKMTDGLITNFHQPNSTLLLLIASLVGDDWKRIYRFALEKNYRFLSYGDSSLLLPFRYL